MKSNDKTKAIERANIRLLERNGEISLNEDNGPQVGTNIVTFKGQLKGRVVGLNYVVNLENGKTVILKQHEFYNNDSDDDLPF